MIARLLIATTIIFCVAHAEMTFQEKLQTLIEQNLTAPALPAVCSTHRCGVLTQICSQPIVMSCEASPEDNMRDYLAHKLRYKKTTLSRAVYDNTVRRALVTEYLKHHKLSLNNACCGPSLPFLPHVLTATTCCFYYADSMAYCPHVFDPNIPEYPDAPSAIAATVSVLAARLTCKAAELCCIRLFHDDEDVFKRPH